MARGADAARKGYRKCAVTRAQICDARRRLQLDPRGEALHLAGRRAMNKRQIWQAGDCKNANTRQR
jgi:hypothetical protein